MKPWDAVQATFDDGRLCDGCRFERSFEGSRYEAPWRICRLLDGDIFNPDPFECPGLKGMTPDDFDEDN